MSSPLLVRSAEELNLIRKSGWISARALKKVLDNTKPGVRLDELDSIAEEEILSLGGEPSFKTVSGYDFTTCLTINDEVVHGLPRPVKLKEGDVLGIDLGAVYKGWHTDTAWSVIVRQQATGSIKQAEKERFLNVGEETLWKAIAQAVEGKRIGDISFAIQNGVEGGGYNVVKSLAGHGVGKMAHEEPEIPEYGKPKTGLKLKKGMTIAVEVIYTAGSGDVEVTTDGWTVASKDKSLGGLFEMSVIVGKKKAEVLTDWRLS